MDGRTTTTTSATNQHGSTSPPPPPPRVQVLIVDDHADTRQTFARILESLGFAVAALDNGSAAMQYLAEHSPDLVLLDQVMPGKTGLEVLSELAAGAAHRPKFVLLTGMSDPQTESAARAHGAAAVWVKGHIDYARIRENIEQILCAPG